MGVLVYTETKFNEPGLIPRATYENLKMNYRKNPQFNLISEHDSFQEMVRDYYLWMIISLIVMLIGFGLGEGITTVIGGFAMLSFFFSVIYYLLEAPSKRKFIKKRNEYLAKLESVIKESVDYDDFVKFYYVQQGGFMKFYTLTKRRQR